LPVVEAGTYGPFCIDVSAITLVGSPMGGTFSGLGISGNTFDPTIAGIGSHVITYEYIDPVTNCENSAETTIVVNDLPMVNAGMYGPFCIDEPAATLSGTPSGGTFSGPGVSGNMFDPATAGEGTHIITYAFTDGNGCINSATTDIVVNGLPIVDAGTYADLCLNDDPIDLTGSPSGGTFSGTGVSGDLFDPSVSGEGTFVITYEFRNVNGCWNTATTSIIVKPLPTVDAGTYADLCEDDAPISLAGTPSGGLFSGPGVVGNMFDPSLGAGTYTITYSFTAANGCTNSAMTDITVNGVVVDPGTYGPLCLDGTPITLSGTPSGGTFSGIGQ